MKLKCPKRELEMKDAYQVWDNELLNSKPQNSYPYTRAKGSTNQPSSPVFVQTRGLINGIRQSHINGPN